LANTLARTIAAFSTPNVGTESNWLQRNVMTAIFETKMAAAQHALLNVPGNVLFQEENALKTHVEMAK